MKQLTHTYTHSLYYDLTYSSMNRFGKTSVYIAPLDHAKKTVSNQDAYDE